MSPFFSDASSGRPKHCCKSVMDLEKMIASTVCPTKLTGCWCTSTPKKARGCYNRLLKLGCLNVARLAGSVKAGEAVGLCCEGLEKGFYSLKVDRRIYALLSARKMRSRGLDGPVPSRSSAG